MGSMDVDRRIQDGVELTIKGWTYFNGRPITVWTESGESGTVRKAMALGGVDWFEGEVFDSVSDLKREVSGRIGKEMAEHWTALEKLKSELDHLEEFRG